MSEAGLWLTLHWMANRIWGSRVDNIITFTVVALTIFVAAMLMVVVLEYVKPR